MSSLSGVKSTDKILIASHSFGDPKVSISGLVKIRDILIKTGIASSDQVILKTTKPCEDKEITILPLFSEPASFGSKKNVLPIQNLALQIIFSADDDPGLAFLLFEKNPGIPTIAISDNGREPCTLPFSIGHYQTIVLGLDEGDNCVLIKRIVREVLERKRELNFIDLSGSRGFRSSELKDNTPYILNLDQILNMGITESTGRSTLPELETKVYKTWRLHNYCLIQKNM